MFAVSVFSLTNIQTSAWKVECLLGATLRQTLVNGKISVSGSLFGSGTRMVQPPPTLAHQWTTLLAQSWVKYFGEQLTWNVLYNVYVWGWCEFFFFLEVSYAHQLKYSKT